MSEASYDSTSTLCNAIGIVSNLCLILNLGSKGATFGAAPFCAAQAVASRFHAWVFGDSSLSHTSMLSDSILVALIVALMVALIIAVISARLFALISWRLSGDQ